MLPRSLLMVALAVLSTACAHKGARRVDCDGPLRPINRPAAPEQAPVTVEGATASPLQSGEKQP